MHAGLQLGCVCLAGLALPLHIAQAPPKGLSPACVCSVMCRVVHPPRLPHARARAHTHTHTGMHTETQLLGRQLLPLILHHTHTVTVTRTLLCTEPQLLERQQKRQLWSERSGLANDVQVCVHICVCACVCVCACACVCGGVCVWGGR